MQILEYTHLLYALSALNLLLVDCLLWFMGCIGLVGIELVSFSLQPFLMELWVERDMGLGRGILSLLSQTFGALEVRATGEVG